MVKLSYIATFYPTKSKALQLQGHFHQVDGMAFYLFWTIISYPRFFAQDG